MAETKRKITTGRAILMILFGVAFAIWPAFNLMNVMELDKSSHITKATVKNIKHNNGKQKVKMSYRTVSNQTIVGEFETDAGFLKDLKVGDKVRLRYSKSNPRQATLVENDKWLIVVMPIGAVSLFLGFVFLFRNFFVKP